MTQERLNHVAVHHVHNKRVDALDINKIKRLFMQGALKMREWKMQEWKMQERQSMESHKKKIL